MINGLKLIYQTGRVDIPDDPSYPLRLDLNFRPPEFMIVAFVSRHGGSEDVVVRAKTMEALVQFLVQNEFLSHPRIRQATVTGPDGLRENLELGSPPRCVRMGKMEVYSNGKQVKARTLDGRVQSMSDALIEKAAKALAAEAIAKATNAPACPSHPEGGPCEPMRNEPGRCVYGEHAIYKATGVKP